jgi:hypothetical protein
MWTVTTPSTASQGAMVVDLDLTIFLTPDDTLTVLSTDDAVIMAGSVRHVATVFGQLVNPVGFTLE